MNQVSAFKDYYQRLNLLKWLNRQIEERIRDIESYPEKHRGTVAILQIYKDALQENKRIKKELKSQLYHRLSGKDKNV